MQTSAFRVEVIRFSLLVTVTVALLSIAIRLASHSDSHPGAQPSGHPHVTASSSTTTPPATGPTATSPATSPAATTPSSTATPGSTTTGSTTAGSTTTGSGGGSAGPTQPVLPVTGYGAAVKLTALSMVLIGAGALTVRSSRR